jgi:predicted metal-dependent hydrolase
MATKHITIDGVGDILLVKTRASRQLRLSITSKGIRVSVPSWTPFLVAEQFAHSHREWILRHRAKMPLKHIQDGQRVGRLHTLSFEPQPLNGRSTTRVTGTRIIVFLGSGETTFLPAVQNRAAIACERALRKEAEQLLPPRLTALSEKFGLPYQSVTIKKLTRRWGSCDSHKNIVLNLYLTELPWEFIDYVILHELTHTVHMHHGTEFWKFLSKLMPRAKDVRRELRRYQPTLNPRSEA